MYLKSLTLKGFKSFASSTTLRFEPGITCVVGPNGSGKSNVVDALAWVMGEQGAKSLRGGSMEDVIFAGTPNRPPLGRAEVSLTIDNSDGALPIDYTEVTISRTRFRSGGSEYAINNAPARLLDVQELLSDSGIGQEMHVIVGQGQLDAVLRATPVERRGFVEEAAGVLKHRKRKEKALRKLDAMQANLTRLTDLTAELRRQLGPLGRQADLARRAATVATQARDARARLLADDLVQLTASLEQEVADESALLARRDEVEADLATARLAVTDLATAAEQASPRFATASQVWFSLSRLRDRCDATATLAAERIRLLGSDDSTDPATDAPDPERLLDQARQVRAQEGELERTVAGLRDDLARCSRVRAEVEAAHHAAEQALAALARAAADRREGLARLQGQVGAARSRVESAHAEIGRLEEAAKDAGARAQQAQQEFTLLEQQVAGVEAGEESLDEEYEAAQQNAARAAADVDALLEAERAADRDRATWTARREALELSLSTGDEVDLAEVVGVWGPVRAHLHVRAGYEDAVAAALGPVTDAFAVESVATAVDAIRHVREHGAGRTRLVVAGAEPLPRGTGPASSGRERADEQPVGELLVDEQRVAEQPAQGRGVPLDGPPATATPARSLVTGPAGMAPALDQLLANIVVVEELSTAREIVDDRPELVAVTRTGDVVGAAQAVGGGEERSGLHVQAALQEAQDRVRDAVGRSEQARFALQGAREAARESAEAVEAALDRLHANDARYAAVAERLGQLAATVRSAGAERDRLTGNLDQASTALTGHETALADLGARLRAAQDATHDDPTEPDTGERDDLAARASAARAEEMEARLAVRTAEERSTALSGRAAGLERAAERERQARQRAAERARQRQRQVEAARGVHAGTQLLGARLERALAQAADERDEAQGERARLDADLTTARSRQDDLAAELARLTDTVHRDELARAEQRLRIDQLQERAMAELGLTAEVLVEEFGPHLPVLVEPGRPVPPSSDDPDHSPSSVPYVRQEQEKRLRQAERALTALGKVNPLALEEFAALEERHKFLTEQLDDLTRSKADLLGLVGEIDARVQQVFADAYADTARAFEEVFPRLFPGGEGRLVLTDPADMLTTGIDVEARPAGKKVKRLSLLSGGERSLTAVAMLVAIFKARPSPFYVMDEVEAALDDVNLGRLIGIFNELRDSSQLIVITHQKRTMEGADALYGVTMRGDGVSTVISQRMGP